MHPDRSENPDPYGGPGGPSYGPNPYDRNPYDRDPYEHPRGRQTPPGAAPDRSPGDAAGRGGPPGYHAVPRGPVPAAADPARGGSRGADRPPTTRQFAVPDFGTTPHAHAHTVEGRPTIGAALSWSWRRITANAALFLGISGGAVALIAVLAVVAAFVGDTLGTALSITSIFLVFYAAMLLTVGAVAVADGARPTITEVFARLGTEPHLTNRALGTLVVPMVAAIASLVVLTFVLASFGSDSTAVVAAAVVVVGAVGVAIHVLFWWGPAYVVDQGAGFADALRGSFGLVRANVGLSVSLALVLLGITVVGMIPFGLGTVVTMPLCVLTLVFTYRLLIGKPVAP